MKMMNHRFFSGMLITTLLILNLGCDKEIILEPPDGLSRGVNLGNALEAPNEGDWGVVLEEKYFQLIKDAGFDFVRIPIRWSSHAEMEAPHQIDPGFFERIDWAVNQSISRDLAVIINIQHYIEIMNEPEENESRFLSLWQEISDHYKNYPGNLYFELLNEPHDKLDNVIWNKYLQEAIKVIRETNPNRTIIVGPTEWNNISELEHLSLPVDDENVVVTFHYYSPFEFTHQGAEWVDGSNKWLGTKWSGTSSEKEAIRRDLDKAVQWAKDHNRALLLGEFGAYSKADMDSRVCWSSFVAREAEKRGIAWAYWEFCAGFGIYDPEAEKWRIKLFQALIPEAK